MHWLAPGHQLHLQPWLFLLPAMPSNCSSIYNDPNKYDFLSFQRQNKIIALWENCEKVSFESDTKTCFSFSPETQLKTLFWVSFNTNLSADVLLLWSSVIYINFQLLKVVLVFIAVIVIAEVKNGEAKTQTQPL